MPATIPVRNVRAVTSRPLSDRQLEIVKRLAAGQTHAEIAEALHCGLASVRTHIREAGNRVPGDGAASTRLVYWYRGASRELLAGE